MSYDGITLKILTVEDFENNFKEKLSPFLCEKIEACDFTYYDLSKEESDRLFIDILEHLGQDLRASGPHREREWEFGWNENRKEFEKNPVKENLIPRYFGKLPYVRWQQKFIKPTSRDFEYNMASILQYWLFEKYFKTIHHVYEFGCGTGHNLFRVKEVNSDVRTCGLDWVDSAGTTISLINKHLNQNFDFHKFNFFDVDHDYKLAMNSGVYTFAALEQVGGQGEEFFQYLMGQNCQVGVHIEPMEDFLEPGISLIDYLSVEYFRKRGYCYGLYDTLKKYEKDGIIEIVQATRSYIGSQFVDGYSILAWRRK